MIAGGLAKDDIAAFRSGLAVLRQLLVADHAAGYLVEPTPTNGILRLVPVASEPAITDEMPASVVVPGAVAEQVYVPDLLAPDLLTPDLLAPTAGSPGAEGAEPAIVQPVRCLLGPLTGSCDHESVIRTYFRVPVNSAGRRAGQTSCLIEFVAARAEAFAEPDRDAVLTFAPVLGTVLENAWRQKAMGSFLALAAHELRTPLTTAAGFAQTIADHFERLDQVMIQDLLARILRNHTRLDRLVDDLVDLSSIKSGHLHVTPGPVPVGPLLAEAVRGADSGSHPISVELPDGLPMLWADRDRLEQVLTNLLANAAKFSPEGTPINVRVSLREAASGERLIAIEVVDHGQGVAPEFQERIFDAYYQGDAVTAGGRRRGLGIGLYLTRLLCELMGGTVHVDSQPGCGSTFVVTLPAAAEP